MPSGRTHNLINLATFAVLGSAALYAQRAGYLSFQPGDALAFSASYAVGTVFLSPDLDLAENNVNSKRAWGVLGVLWVPYGLLFSHRGWSHSWIVGPLTRLVYLALMVAILLGLAHLALPHLALPQLASPDRIWPALPAPVTPTLALPLLAGYYVSQWLHLIADGVRPDHKMRLRRR